MHFLFIADEISTLSPKGDSSLSLVRESLRRKHRVSWCTAEEVRLKKATPFVWASQVVSCPPEGLAALSVERDLLELADLDAVLIRKNPPFDSRYLQLCWLLSLAERKVYMLNRASLLLRYHEKLIPQEALSRGALTEKDLIPTFLNATQEANEYFESEKISQIVSKPFLGFGGSDIELLSKEQFESLLDKDPIFFKDRLLQPFQEEIRDGDFRVFLLDGAILGSFCRLPKAGSFVSNLAQGGTAVSKLLTPKQKEVVARLGAYLKNIGIAFAGADLIGEKISEVNVTSPTGLQSLLNLEGKDYSQEIIRHLERNTVLFPY